MSKQIGVGVIGLGFMGQTHLNAYRSAASAGLPRKVVAVCDQDPQRLTAGATSSGHQITTAIGKARANSRSKTAAVDLNAVATYTDTRALFADPNVQAVSICTHTDTHVDLTIQALKAGKHVLVEKPLAVKSADARRAVDAARKAKTICMPGLCMRFWPGWSWLKQQIERGTYGAVRSAVFERLASPPAWAPDFYRDATRSGGALVDLHIHDADFVRWCFGDPAGVSSTGTTDHLTTLYRYENDRGPRHVVAEGGWDHSPGFPFRMRYVVVFEKATAEFESDREAPLVLVHRGEQTAVPLEAVTGWELEVQHFIDVIARSKREAIVTVDDALAVTRLLEAEAESLRTGKTIAPRMAAAGS